MRRIMVAGLALGICMAGTPRVEAFNFGSLGRIKKVQSQLDKAKAAQRKIDKAKKLYSQLSGGMAGIREELQNRVLANKKVSKVMNKYLGAKEKFRAAWDGEMDTEGKSSLLSKILENRKALAALKHGNFQQAFASANVKLPKLLQPLATGEATNLGGALRVSAMKKLEAKGFSPAALKGLRGKLSLNTMAYFALRKNEKFGAAFQNAYEGGGGFSQVINGMAADKRNDLIQKLTKNGSALEKFQNGAWGSALQLVGVSVPNIPGVTPPTEEAPAESGEVAEEGYGDEEGPADDGEAYDDTGSTDAEGDTDYE